ncbi:MAG: TetR/AcrR family transcriptional regulator [Tissierellia bacterium]|nr:TetR/AcrR family transcriptional regulator [Tissierellia bacterium]
MPKEVFYNLPDEKREKILVVLKKEFKSKPFQKVNVKAIVEELGIARGSFYQYFENLEDAYFTILEKETVDIHGLFMKIFVLKDRNLRESLVEYGKEISEIIFDQNSYMIYKNRYLYWNEDLNKSWESSHRNQEKLFRDMSENGLMDLEKIHFIKSIIHSLIERIFRENWSKEEFLEKYIKHLIWIEKGVIDGNL